MPDFRIEIHKKARTLELYDGKQLIKTYSVALGSVPIGDKETEGDGKTPEGSFYIYTKNSESKFHLSLGISYPSTEDATRGLDGNLISKDEADAISTAVQGKKMPPQKTKLGGEIYIHGGGTETDWTDGCIALQNDEMEELFGLIHIGAKIDISESDRDILKAKTCEIVLIV